MDILSKISELLSLKEKDDDEPDIRYAHPSHDPKNCARMKLNQSKQNNEYQSVLKQRRSTWRYSANKKISVGQKRDMVQHFLNSENLSELNLSCILNAGSDGLSTHDVNMYVISHVLGDGPYIEVAAKYKKITDLLHKERVNLCKLGKIGFNSEQKVWYPGNIRTRNLTNKEERFLKARGLVTDQWINIPNELEAIKWLHREFTPDEFEQFCCSLLEHLDGKNIHITQKRRSGADGGIDGLGEYKKEDDGTIVRIAFEAKKHDPSAQIGSDICQKLAGAMMENGIDHGVIITTATFSERAQQSVVKMRANENYRIELVDQKRIVEIMAYKGKLPHGFGLYKSEKNFVYMNESILRRAACTASTISK